MNSRKFLIGTLISVFLVVFLIIAFNYITDPFGVFSDRFFKWMSYDFTTNPRTAKITYLDENHSKYNAYIVGSSGASAIPIDELNGYSGNKFFNSFYYGADMYDSLNTVRYILDHYEANEIFLPISFSSANIYHSENDSLNYRMNYKVEQYSPLDFWSAYALANPHFGLEKISSFFQDSYFPKAFDVFKAESGLYDKSVRDVEHIGDTQEYLKKYPTFKTEATAKKDMKESEDCFDAIRKIKEYCNAKNVKLTVLLYPIYKTELGSYEDKKINDFYQSLGSITDYWDFTYSSISYEPRYFYDFYHYRNDVGRMMLEKIYGRTDSYVPEDFGTYVAQNETRTIDEVRSGAGYDLQRYSTKVPVLTFHHISEDGKNTATISKKKFTEVMNYLKEKGYNTISVDDLWNYVNNGKELPKQPILITFDDGYESNYEVAFPILQANRQKAAIFIIGSSLGKSTYKDTNEPIIPHFTLEQAKEMIASGLIQIGSHTYDMHQSKQLEKSADPRLNLLKLPGESEKEYIEAVRKDMDQFNQLYRGISDQPVNMLSYPSGYSDASVDVLLSEAGIRCTFGITEGNNDILKGLPQSLFELKRNNVSEDTDIEKLMTGLETEAPAK